MVSIALFQPDIPQNCGAILRLGACLGVQIAVIGPTGFDLSDRRLRRAGLDYLDQVELIRHAGWDDFLAARRNAGGRLVLLTTQAERSYADVAFDADDVLILGRESAGVPDYVHAAADLSVKVPLVAGARSLNIVAAGAMVLGEALRQTRRFPPDH